MKKKGYKIVLAIILSCAFAKASNAQSASADLATSANQVKEKHGVKQRELPQFIKSDSAIAAEYPGKQIKDSLLRLNRYRFSHPIRGARAKGDTLAKPLIIIHDR